MKYACLLLSLLICNSIISQNLKRAVPSKEMLSALPEYCNSDQLIIKISENSNTARPDYFLETDGTLMQTIRSAMEGKKLPIQTLIKQPKELLLSLKENGERRSGITLGNLSLFYQIDLGGLDGAERILVHNKLLQIPELETVYFPLKYSSTVSIPSKPGFNAQVTTPDLSGSQFYLNPAPDGVDAKYAWTKPGGDGLGINFCDVELGLNKTHEDIAFGNVTDISVFPSTTDDHGTAVHGVVYADHNGFGVDGMAHKIKPYFSNARDSAGGFDIAGSMARAIPFLDSGDVLLIEMMDQSGDPNSSYAPVEFSQAEFDVIQNMTASGIIVIEAAGNGNKNLDDQTKYGQKFDSTFRYSGAFMVGGIRAGTSKGGTNPAHQRRHPSSYGSRVDFHSYSEQVTTCGYGDLYGNTNNDKYTEQFFGTSSASPIIAGAAILLESIYKSMTGGQTLDHKELKSLLRHGATPSYAPGTDKVGVMPDLKDAIDLMLLASSVNQQDESDNSVRVFPTLADAELFVSGNEFCSSAYSIYDVSGRRVSEGALQLSSSIGRIDVSGLEAGIYILKVAGLEKEAQVKFVKK